MNNIQAKAVASTIREAVLGVLRDRFGEDAIRDVELSYVEDDDGEELLRIDVQHRLSPEAANTRLTYGLTQVIRERLWALGESNDCWIRHHYDERQRVAS